MTDLSNFSQGLKDFEKEVKDEMLYVTKKVATKAFETLTIRSPAPDNLDAPYSLGSYMLSHRIGIGGPSPDPFILIPEEAGPFPNTRQIVLHELKNKLPKAKAFDKIVINNTVPHAQAVEEGKAGGFWPESEGYYPFLKTNQYMAVSLNSTVKTASAEYAANKR